MGNITFLDDKYLDLSFHYWGTGTQASFEHEPYELDSWGDKQKLLLPKMTDDDDCLGLNLRKHADFGDGFFTYASVADRFAVHFQDTTTSVIDRNKCIPLTTV